MKHKLLVVISILCLHSSAFAQYAAVSTVVPTVIKVISHDPDAFTQGLEFKNGKLYESTGLYDKSTIRVLDINGKVLKKNPVRNVFAEGCTILGNKLYQLTWKEMQCIVYSFPDLVYKKAFVYDGEGWGLTNNKKQFLMSNGSDTIYFRDTTFKVVSKLPVKINGVPLKNINELEYARKSIFANVWFDNAIYRIDLSGGAVKQVIDCRSIVKQERVESDERVLNGIAYNEITDCFYITGKNWKHIYLVSIP